MLFTFTGNNPRFVEQSLFDPDLFFTAVVSSISSTEIVLTQPIYPSANVFVVLRGTGFVQNQDGSFSNGLITSIEFNGLDRVQGTISDISWDLLEFGAALIAIDTNVDFDPLGILFGSSGPITIDASNALTGFNQELTWGPFLPVVTQPITFIGSPFDDAVAGSAQDDVIETRGSGDNGDRIVGSAGNDTIVFTLPDLAIGTGFTLDYDVFDSPVSFTVNGVDNTGSVVGPGFTDTLVDVSSALDLYLGLEGTAGDDNYAFTLQGNQLVAAIGGPGADSYSIISNGGRPVLDFYFNDVTAGIDVNLATGIIANDGFGETEDLAIIGTPTLTVVRGTDLVDLVTDAPGNQLIRTFGGNDTVILGNGGNDSVDGGAGIDTVIFDALDQAQLTITFDGAISAVTDRQASSGDTALLDVERIQTEGGVVFELDKHDGIGRISSTDLVALTELYIAYFNRAADALGLSFWATAFEYNGFSLREIAELFFDQIETRALYDGMSNGDFVDAVYNNVFGRNADSGGFDFWVDQLDSGNVSQAEFIVDFLAGARAATGSPEDVRFIEAKTDIGLYFAVIQGQSDVAAANSVMDAYDGTAQGLANAINLADANFADATASADALLLPVLGVIDNPFPDIA